MRKNKSKKRRALPEYETAARAGSKFGDVSKAACVAVCGYWALFGIPTPWDVSLIALALVTAWAAMRPAGVGCAKHFSRWILFFVAAVLLSIPAARDIARSFHFVLALVPSLMIFYLLSEKIEGAHLRWLAIWLVIVTLCLGLWLLYIAWNSDAGGGPSEWIEAARITFLRVPNDVVMLVILSPFSLAFPIRKPRSGMGVTGAIGLMVIAAVAVVYRSRLSVLLLLLVLSLFGGMAADRKKILLAIPLLLAVLFVLDLATGGFLRAKFSSTWDSRLPLWLASWCMFLKAPFLGSGPGSYLRDHRDCLESLVASGGLHLDDPRIAPWAHNLYLEVLAEQGLTGFFSLIALLVYGIVAGYRVLSRVEGSMGLLGSTALASLLAFCVAANFELSLWRQWVTVVLFTLMGIVAGIHRICQIDRGLNEKAF